MNFLQDPDSSSSSNPVVNDEWKYIEGNQQLQHLTTSNFDEFVKDKKVLVLFYAPCKYRSTYPI